MSINSQVGQVADTLQRVLAYLEAGSSQSASVPAVSPPQPAAPQPPADTAQGSHVGSMPRLASPERFSGDSGDCRTFLIQCDLHFKLLPYVYNTDYARVAFIISHLSGRAATWATYY